MKNDNKTNEQLLKEINELKTKEALNQFEKNFRDIFNNTIDAIYIQDKEGHFLEVNQGAVDMYGYPKKFFIGKTPEFLSAPGKNDMKKIIGFVKNAFNGKPQRYDFWGIRKNGEVFPKIVRSHHGLYLDQKVVITFALDITDRKKAEDALEESEERFSSIFSNISNIAVQGYDKERKVTFWNKASEKLYGYSQDEAMNKHLEELIIPPEMRENVILMINNWHENNVPIPNGELVLMKKDKSLIHVYSSHVMIEKSNKEKEMFCIDINITERKKAEEK
ncbi:MAG: PAS domain S-box protein, partial [FCB group bacterium]|nr:PAS domain S-box protein [FCB group bacterium]